MSPKLQINEHANGLNIRFGWFHYSAIFLVFFCVFWDGFLVFWYALTLGSAPLIFNLFPLLHVSVGVGLTYYTICLFVNRTDVLVDRYGISVRSGPLPWPGANKNVPVADVEQLYVVEKVSHGKNGTTYTYTLMASLKTGAKVKVLESGQSLEVHQMQEIERKIETFLGIPDYAVSGEYAASTKASMHDAAPRELNKPYNPTAIQLADVRVGTVLDYDLSTWQVSFLTQYDWSNGQTDKQFQLINRNSANMLLFLQQDMALIKPWKETLISPFDLGLNDGEVLERDVPREVLYKGIKYYKDQRHTGKMFVNDTRHFTRIVEYILSSESKNEHLRIVLIDRQSVQTYAGVRIPESAFSNIYIGEGK